ncbi:right-handed parallel beta-helix repeat-containing protein [Pelagicoccus sp. SDUM812002]|uniref:right-handed parallel beta-helix repeat-containing protein n=1 Tax=Pelagicoccus sp. SDUM812002 TaxID=3041266 RepID=UPI00280DCA6A|nr:right-handed parallel beta-helix repeat-containing protein [Pelagicoccus sp. SDUM812002]MDQ8184068.1 right-handed parallel beta-helix repeat-containing protein [Pelagicoccus sp. SDUM812002]
MSTTSKTPVRRLLLFIIALGLPVLAFAKPSGGPYGPVRLNYELPAVDGTIYYVAPEGSEEAEGTSLQRPTSIEAAFARAVDGDALVLRGGTYRSGNLVFNQGLVIQPYADEVPIVKGTAVAEDWESLRDGLWRTKWETLFPMKPETWWRRHREAARTPLYRFNNDMVFVDGRMLQQVGWPGELDAESFYIDYEEGFVYTATDPEGKTIEITAFDNALTRTIEEVHGMEPSTVGPQVRGIIFTQYAYRAIEIEGYDPEEVSPESNHGKDVVGSVFENCTFSYCSRVGGYFRGDGLVIRNCLVSHTSTEGLFILSSNDVLIERNIVTHNNMEKITGYYVTAIKIFNQCYRVTCRENLIIDNEDSSGIWYDVGNVDGLFVNNWIQNTDNGFFFEISKGAICTGNVFVDCPQGIFVLNSERVRVYQNTMVNSTVTFERTDRSAVGDHFDWHPASGPKVEERHGHAFMGNLLYADDSHNGPVLKFRQREVLRDRLTDPQAVAIDGNVYVRDGYTNHGPLIQWSPSASDENSVLLETPGDLHALYPEFSGDSQWFVGYNGPMFQGKQTNRFELMPDFVGLDSTAELPGEALKALGWKKKDVRHPGAFPVAE